MVWQLSPESVNLMVPCNFDVKRASTTFDPRLTFKSLFTLSLSLSSSTETIIQHHLHAEAIKLITYCAEGIKDNCDELVIGSDVLRVSTLRKLISCLCDANAIAEELSLSRESLIKFPSENVFFSWFRGHFGYFLLSQSFLEPKNDFNGTTQLLITQLPACGRAREISGSDQKSTRIFSATISIWDDSRLWNIRLLKSNGPGDMNLHLSG